MRVRMKATLSGTRDGEAWPPRGGTVDLPDDEATHLIRAGMAEKSDKVEEASVATEETGTESKDAGEDNDPIEETATPPDKAEQAVPSRRRGQAKKPGNE